VALFVDAGSVANQAADLRPHIGLGSGLRWKSPIGPLQIDLAYGRSTRKLRLHLNLGFNF
jgi:translocation and assembly module TamA